MTDPSVIPPGTPGPCLPREHPGSAPKGWEEAGCPALTHERPWGKAGFVLPGGKMSHRGTAGPCQRPSTGPG